MIRDYMLFIIIALFMQSSDFLSDQRKYPRVCQAIEQKLQTIQDLFSQKNTAFPPEKIFIRGFKTEQVLELWIQSTESDTFIFLKDYSFCSSSGIPGPKRKQGDLQIPEGFYYIDRFNPASNFYLSLGINYPNASDRILAEKDNPGGDIFIHGNCVTIGCIPITDELIKELYVIALYSKSKGQEKIDVHIFPFKMTDGQLAEMEKMYPGNILFWNNLKGGYRYFEEHHKTPNVTIDSKSGQYLFDDKNAE